MSKPKKTPLLYPLIGKDGTTEFVDRKTFLAAKSKEYSKKYKGIDCSAKVLAELVDMEVASEEPVDETSEEYKAIFAELAANHQAAVAHQAEATTEAAAETNAALTTLNTALDYTIPAEVLDTKFKVSSIGVEILEGATQDDIASKMLRLIDGQAFSSWAIGDLGNALQQFKDGDSIIDNLMAKTGRAGSTVYGYMKIAKAVPFEQRTAKLLPTVVAEIILPKISENPKKDAQIKTKLLKEAVEKNMNSREARSHVNAARSGKAGKQGKGSKVKPAKFLIVPKEGKPYLVADEPGLDDDVVAINLETRQVLVDDIPKPDGKKGEVLIGWADIETKE